MRILPDALMNLSSNARRILDTSSGIMGLALEKNKGKHKYKVERSSGRSWVYFWRPCRGVNLPTLFYNDFVFRASTIPLIFLYKGETSSTWLQSTFIQNTVKLFYEKLAAKFPECCIPVTKKYSFSRLFFIVLLETRAILRQGEYGGNEFSHDSSTRYQKILKGLNQAWGGGLVAPEFVGPKKVAKSERCAKY
ncbi:hypothetical protein POM88_016519 [Heracleum sosnowskyi]|uniref:Uncharacterized protein n=1 Tax=Heracleum sosnowskyi TaxID=360622 RepID=A0AAD8IMR4_9APIA|nr:hypothetical protein POM88_016519 [Heracleum sosnowskyi]